MQYGAQTKGRKSWDAKECQILKKKIIIIKETHFKEEVTHN